MLAVELYAIMSSEKTALEFLQKMKLIYEINVMVKQRCTRGKRLVMGEIREISTI